MFNIVLYQPEIPPNTGNLIRLAANTGCRLHLVKPLGFNLEDKQLRRAGLDYHELGSVHVHEDWPGFLQACAPQRLYAFSTKGKSLYTEIRYENGDFLLFGPESRGLPEALRESSEVTAVLTLPMQRHNRSLNLSNAVAVVVYEAWRQTGFAGAG
jgi:tRNA (cytidine/uridine-2'-O-)-methyltransferase